MALTSRINASIYGIDGNALSRAGLSGITNSFPSNQCLIYAARAGTTANTVAIQSVIELLPSGLNQKTRTFWTDATVAQINSSGT